MKRIRQPTILNSQGEPIRLTKQEQYHADYMQRKINSRFGNSLGYEISITTLTTIMKKISEQKFFEVPPADYLLVRVGLQSRGPAVTLARDSRARRAHRLRGWRRCPNCRARDFRRADHGARDI